MQFRLMVNGSSRAVDAPAETPLLWVLRDDLQLTGTKYGCGVGACGACTVHLTGAAIRSCTTPLSAIAGRPITTIEGLQTAIGRAVSAAWLAEDVAQCGYCQTGQIMTACALLATHATPTDAEIDGAMAGNICRCGTYQRIRKAVHRAAAGT